MYIQLASLGYFGAKMNFLATNSYTVYTVGRQMSFYLDNSRPIQKLWSVCFIILTYYSVFSYIQGVATLNTYRFFHWSQVDIFIYFSHNFITIPPPVWIDASHLHSVPILGTLITESVEGYELCNKLLTNKDSCLIPNFLHKLVQLAEHYNFDGWLINIENKIEEENIKVLLELIRSLTMQMHHAVPGSLVLWYDSILKNGELLWQNELNLNNKVFFDACDGIYLNYNWNEDLLQKSAKLAGDRITDVFAGIDVFGRGTFGGGGFNTCVAFKAAQIHGLSVAIFGQGWTYEILGQLDFLQNELKFWNCLANLTSHRVPVDLPFHSSFCHGFGHRVYRNGIIVHPNAWSNLSLQQYQIINHDNTAEGDVEENLSTISICTEEAYHGGSCLRLSGIMSDTERRITFKIFRVQLNLNTSVQVSYTTKCSIHTDDELDISLDLTVRSSKDDSKEEIIRHPYIKPSNVLVEKYYNEDLTIQIPTGWITRSFVITSEIEDACITDLDLGISSTSNLDKINSKFEVLLGQLQVVPVDLLYHQPLLEVNCLLVETCRSPSMIKVTSLIKWNGGVAENVVDCYDIFCQLKWAVCDSPETKEYASVVKNDFKAAHTYYVGTTRRKMFKIYNFPININILKTVKFHLQFIVKENVIGIETKPINESAYCEVTV